MRVQEIQTYLRDLDLDGWLLYDFQSANPIARRVAELVDEMLTRRWLLFIPAQGEPRWLYHAIESHSFEGLEGVHNTYARWSEFLRGIDDLCVGSNRIAIEYSPSGEIPYVSRIDGGTLDLLRNTGLELICSGELAQLYEARCSEEAIAEHRKAAQFLLSAKDRTFEFVSQHLREGQRFTEYDIQQFMSGLFEHENIIANCDPIVAVNHRSADPHYIPTPDDHQEVKPGDFLLIDLWGKTKAHGAVYADITWTAYLGTSAPSKHREVFDVVTAARDRGIEFLDQQFSDGRYTPAFEVDDAVRQVINSAGYGDYFFHRTGHNLGFEDHGNGAHLDNYETHDTRPLIPGLLFTIEPGIYLEDFGVRSEINILMSEQGPEVTTLPLQTEIICI